MRPVMVAASWFGTGYSPFAPGTVGTLGAIPFYLLLSGLPLPAYLVVTVVFTLASCFVAGKAEAILGQKDPGKIVIDEVAGYLVTMAAILPTWKAVLAGFFLFRLFDVVKPPPARWIDRGMKNGFGVVLDDIAAGIYACIVMHLISRYL